jgi:hypothetical protein
MIQCNLTESEIEQIIDALKNNKESSQYNRTLLNYFENKLKALKCYKSE